MTEYLYFRLLDEEEAGSAEEQPASNNPTTY